MRAQLPRLAVAWLSASMRRIAVRVRLQSQRPLVSRSTTFDPMTCPFHQCCLSQAAHHGVRAARKTAHVAAHIRESTVVVLHNSEPGKAGIIETASIIENQL